MKINFTSTKISSLPLTKDKAAVSMNQVQTAPSQPAWANDPALKHLMNAASSYQAFINKCHADQDSTIINQTNEDISNKKVALVVDYYYDNGNIIGQRVSPSDPGFDDSDTKIHQLLNSRDGHDSKQQVENDANQIIDDLQLEISRYLGMASDTHTCANKYKTVATVMKAMNVPERSSFFYSEESKVENEEATKYITTALNILNEAENYTTWMGESDTNVFPDTQKSLAQMKDQLNILQTQVNGEA